MSQDVLRVSYSSLNTFESCARKFELDKFYPKRKRDGDNYAGDVGTAIHRAYQNYLITNDKQAAIWELIQAFPFEAEYIQKNDYRNFEAVLATVELMFEDVKMNEYQLATIMRPPSARELAANPSAQPLAVPAIEVPFEIRFPDSKIPPCPRFPNGASISVIGYIDAIMQHYMTSLYRTLDIKSSRMRMDDATAKFVFDSQQVPYGIVVDHVAQDVVERFEVLYLDCYIDLLEPTVKLYPFMKSPTDIEEWCTNKLIQFRQIGMFVEMDYFPRTDSGCVFYQKPCRYLEPCHSRDRAALDMWFLMGEEPSQEEPFEPWIVADVAIGA